MDKIDTYSLRGLCMLMIMIHHAYKIFVSDYGYPSNMIVSYWGDLGTGVFFFISGFGLFHSLTRSSKRLPEYLGGAIKKLLIPYAIVFAVSVGIMAMVNPSDVDWTLITKFFTLTIPYTTTWFFKVICALYLVSIFAFYSKIGESAKIGIVTLCVLLYFYFGKYVFHLAPYLFCTTINFPIGMLFAKLNRDGKIAKMEGLLVFAILFVVCLKFRDYPLALYSPFFSLMCVLLCSIVDVSNVLFDYIGRNSLLFYLFHIAIIHDASAFSKSEWLFIGLLFCATFIFVVSYKWFERRFSTGR